MNPLKLIVAFPALLALCAGCASPTPAAPRDYADWHSWARSQGGPVLGNCQSRAAAVCRRVTSQSINRPIVVHVLATRALTAFAWPDRNVFVSAGLVDALSDDELAAAISHEIGHLLDNGRVHSVQALSGGPYQDAEVRADHYGAGLLQQRHIPIRNMISMLTKVRAAQPPDAPCRIPLLKRIQILENRPE